VKSQDAPRSRSSEWHSGFETYRRQQCRYEPTAEQTKSTQWHRRHFTLQQTVSHSNQHAQRWSDK